MRWSQSSRGLMGPFGADLIVTNPVTVPIDVTASTNALETEIANLKNLLTDLERKLNEEKARADALQSDKTTLLNRIETARQSVINFNNMIKSWLT